MKKYIFLTFSLLFPVLAKAVIPEYGMYYNQFRQGLGYYVEIQGTTLVLIVYSYDEETEEPAFYYASGTITRGTHLTSSTFDPPFPMLYDYPYEFTGSLYRFRKGPCLTCEVKEWNTSEHAEKVGDVVMNFWDSARIGIGFWLSDGSWVKTLNLRQVFGRNGYLIRNEAYFEPPIWIPFPSYQGMWVFSDMFDADEPLWAVDFNHVKGPYVPDSSPFDSYNYEYSQWMPVVDFIADASNAMLKCYQYGCRFTTEGRDDIYMKFFDAGMDHALGYMAGYSDPELNAYGDGGYVHPDQADWAYRTDHLVRGVHIVDPIPDAAPPPEDTP
ncbi:MAG TPA: hypothetical protein VFN09_09985 [Rhodanobacteraceae bacterium]|nr:hypothetical protein [Rhodanobacteraceae bacterium]